MIFCCLSSLSPHANGRDNVGTTGIAQSDPLAVQTMLISRFVSFMNTWTGGHTKQSKTTPFLIVVLGHESNSKVKELYASLKNVYQKQKVKILNRPVIVKQYNSLEEYLLSGSKADIFYVKEIKKGAELSKIIKHSSVNNIFLLSDGRDLSSRGIHVSFYVSGNKVTFAVNKCSAERAGIKFNYQVYQMASRVINNCDE